MTRSRHRVLGLFFAALLPLLATACSSPAAHRPAPPTTTIPGAGGVDAGATATIAVPYLPADFNPSTPSGDNPVTHMVMEQVWPQPFVTDPSFNIDSSALLLSAEVEGLSPFTVEYVINPRATWSDGTPITAADLAYDWHTRLARSAGLPDSGDVAGYRAISSIRATHGGRTVTVVFRHPYSQWQSLFSDLVPAHVARRFGWTQAFASGDWRRVISGGPFEITSFRPGRDLVLSRNPRYWGPPARVARIRFVVETSSRSLLAALRSGVVSVGELPLSQFAPNALGDGRALESLRPPNTKPNGSNAGGLSWSAYPTSTVWQLCFNMSAGPTRRLELRRAIEHSLDRSEIVADSAQLVDPRLGTALGRLTLAGESSNPNVPGTSPIVPKVPSIYAPPTALADYRLAGYQPGADGALRGGKGGGVLRLTLLEPSADWAVDEAGFVIQAELRSLGVRLRLHQEPLTELLGSMLPRDRFELALVPFSISTDLAAMAPEYTGPVSGPSRPTGGSDPWSTRAPPRTEPGAAQAGTVTRDVCGIDDPQVDHYLAAALLDLNPPQSIAELERAEAVMWSQVASIPLFQAAEALVRSNRLDNVSESPTWAGVLWNAEDWAVRRSVAPRHGASSRS